MGSKVKKEQNPILMLVIGIVAIAVIAFAIFRFVSGPEKQEDSLVTPPPREGSPDFGPLPKENVLGGKSGKPAAGGS